MNNWCRYQRKRIKAGVMPEEQRLLFEALAKSRSDEHTGGRRKKNVDEVSRQQTYICNTIEKGGKEIQTSIQNEKPLKSADDLLSELRAVR